MKAGDMIKGHHFDVMLIEPINDSRLKAYTNRTRSGSEQVFYTGSDSRDWDRYRAEGGTSNSNVKMHDKPDTIKIIPPENHWFAELVEGEWWWVNGCAECCGHERDWMSYIECEKHNVCCTCGIPREELKETPWGGKHGWQCAPCARAEHEAEKKAALEAMPDEYDPWDYRGLDDIKCPYCDYKFQDPWEHCEDSEEEHECPRCDNTFLVTAEPTVYFTCQRKEDEV